MRICNSCKEEKDYTEFYKKPGGKDGRYACCKTCVSNKSKNRYALTSSPESNRKGHLRFQYGLTEIDVLEMYKKQNGCCYICCIPYPLFAKHKGLAVDHCHKTGKVRGLLCYKCNNLLSRADDSIEILKNAIKYLEK